MKLASKMSKFSFTSNRATTFLIISKKASVSCLLLSPYNSSFSRQPGRSAVKNTNVLVTAHPHYPAAVTARRFTGFNLTGNYRNWTGMNYFWTGNSSTPLGKIYANASGQFPYWQWCDSNLNVLGNRLIVNDKQQYSIVLWVCQVVFTTWLSCLSVINVLITSHILPRPIAFVKH